MRMDKMDETVLRKIRLTTFTKRNTEREEGSTHFIQRTKKY